MTSKVKKHIGSHYLLTERQPFVVEYILQEVLNKIIDKLITYHIFRIHSEDCIICGFF